MFTEYLTQKEIEERERWRYPPGDPNLNFKLLDLKDKAGTVFSNLAAGFTRIAGVVSKAGPPIGQSGGYIGGVRPFQLKAVP